MPTALTRTSDASTSDDDDDPQCGRCGYCVRGLDGTVCPECGADLGVVGVVTAADAYHRRVRPWVWAILWTLVLPWPALFATSMLERFVAPHVYDALTRRVIFVQAPYLFATVQVEATGSETGWGRVDWRRVVPLRRMTLKMTSPTAPVKPGPLDVDLDAGTCRVTDGLGRPVGALRPFTPAAVLAWFASAGYDPADARIAARAQDVHAAAVGTTATPPPMFTVLGNSATDAAGPVTGGGLVSAHPAYAFMNPRPVAWFYPGATVAWLLVWAAGLWLIARRHRRSAVAPRRSVATPVGGAN